MRVDEMLADVRVIRSEMPAGIDLRGVTCRSQEVGRGDLFVAVRGVKADGLDFVLPAVRDGASAIVVGSGRFEQALERAREAGAAEGREIGVVEVADEREALALLGRNASRRPDLEMRITGITGTNGKTTTAWLIAAMFEAEGIPCGVMGTVEHRFGAMRQEAARTTPEGPEIHGTLRRMRDAGALACAMEVSSHALDLRRVAGMRFSAAVFTNLTRDHLDFHGDMDRYYAAKRRLFEDLHGGAPALINADDPRGLALARESAGRPLLYGRAEGADFRMEAVTTGVDGTEVTVAAGGERARIRSPLVGMPNAFNLLAASAAARSQGISWEGIRRGAEAVSRVPGRLERVDAGQPFTVVVDYAHTDDALRNVLEVLRPLTRGRLITVFGCGGDRDRSKRPLMGSHAARLSDRAWITSDNPRSEDPMRIIEMILEGVRVHPGREEACRVEPDRARAIRAAVDEAREGDTVLIAGKGHERTQVSREGTIQFDDVEAAREAIAASARARKEHGGGDAR